MHDRWGMAGVPEWQGACVAGMCVHGEGHVWWGHAWQGGHAWWGHAWQERQPLQQTLRILLECILVLQEFCKLPIKLWDACLDKIRG